MSAIILVVAMIVVGLIIGWLAGPIWKNKRPIGVRGDCIASVITANAVGLMDWYVVPSMGFSVLLRNVSIVIEPALSALFVLWIIRAAKK